MKIRFGIIRRVPMPLLLIYKLLLALVLMSFSRWLFYFFNTSYFASVNFFELMRIMMAGLRFDLSALAIVNLPVILLLAVPLVFKYERHWQNIIHALYVVLNSIALALNLIDTVYFRYINKRTTSELFQFFGNEAENRIPVLGGIFADYWYMLLVWFVLIWVLYKAGKYFVPLSPQPVRKYSWFIWQGVILQLWLAAAVLMIRGGVQLKPINLVAAAKYTSPENMALVLNTPFTIVKTYKSKQLKTVHYFEDGEASKVFNPAGSIKAEALSDTCLKTGNYNVVVIILESFGREHIGFYRTDRQYSYTPFLDSLLGKSYTFDAWANGKRSIEALPSVFAGIPSLMHIDYPTSPYVGNTIYGLGRLLKDKGYSSAFFHGGSNGTMSFDAFAAAAGFDRYVGRTEYGNEQDFDGQWGIYDEPFLQFTAEQLSGMQQPFLAGIFTLSSHHPYNIPGSFLGTFPLSQNEIQQSIAYTDLALRDFFERAEQTDWFRNTLFVLTADHTSEDEKHPFYATMLGNYAIPLAFYLPSVSCGKRSGQPAQHTDILPSVLALTGYEKPYLAFGNNLFDNESQNFSLSYQNGIYQLIMDGYVLHFNGNETVGLFQLTSDPKLEHNLIDEETFVRMRLELYLKAIIQQYNNRMIRNELGLLE